MRRYVVAAKVLFLVLTALGWTWAEPSNVKRLAILPFEVRGGEAYLGQSVQEMLISRVGAGGGLEVVDRGEVLKVLGEGLVVRGRSEALELGRRLEVDYVILGSVTVLGEGVSLDGEVVDVKGGKVLGHIYGESEKMGGVVGEVGRIARHVRGMILGGAEVGPAEAPPAGRGYGTEPPGGYPIPPGGFTGEGGGDIFVSSDEPLLQRRNPQGELNPAFIMSYEMDRARRGYAKSGDLGLKGIQGMGIGDVDGDGATEVVVADEDVVVVYERVMMDLTQRVVIRPSTPKGKILSLDVADINGNGMLEIYITVIQMIGEELSSEVWEYDKAEGRYRLILGSQPYFFRVVKGITGRMELLGQRKRPRMMTDRIGEALYSPFKRPVKLKWEGERLKETEVLPLDDVNVLGLALVDVDRDAVEEYVGFDMLGYMKLFNHRGKVIWVSDGKYGRTGNFYFRDLGRGLGPSEEIPADRVFLPPRLVIVDLDDDGFEEVVFGYNHEAMTLLAQTRVFSKSVVFSMSWDGMDFVENWRTREMKGYIGDCQIRDVDGDGRPELVLGFIRRMGAADYLRTRVSLLAFDLKVQKAKKRSKTQGQGEKSKKGS